MSLILFGAVFMWLLAKVSKALVLLALIALFVMVPMKAILVFGLLVLMLTSF